MSRIKDGDSTIMAMALNFFICLFECVEFIYFLFWILMRTIETFDRLWLCSS